MADVPAASAALIPPPPLPGPPPPDDSKAPFLPEIAVAWRNYFAPAFNGLLQPNDDTLATRGGGKGLRIYDELERDPHCYSVVQKRKMALIAREWQIEPATTRKADQMAADIVTEQLEALQFDRICIDLLDALLKGYSVGEIMWEAGSEIRATDVIARDQRRFVFDAKAQLRQLTLEQAFYGEALPERKFIVHRFGAKDANPYGLGLGTRLFWPVFFKRQGLQFWLMFLDKYGSPTAVGKYPGASTSIQARQVLLDALTAISQESGVAIPQGMEIALLEATRSGNAGYELLCRYLDDEMSKAVLGETMSTTSKGAGMGSSQAAVHNSVRIEITAADADLLAGTLNNTLVRWIAAYNRPDANPPRLWWDVAEAKNLFEQAQADKLVFDMGFKPTLDRITGTYGEGWEERDMTPPPGADPNAPLPTPGSPGLQASDNVQMGEPLPAGADNGERQARLLAQAVDPSLKAWIAAIRGAVDKAIADGKTLQELPDLLLAAFPQMTPTELAKSMQAAMAAAQLAGRYDLLQGLGT